MCRNSGDYLVSRQFNDPSTLDLMALKSGELISFNLHVTVPLNSMSLN